MQAPLPSALRSPPRGGRHLKELDLHVGCRTLAGGSRAAGPPVTFLEEVALQAVVPQHSSHGKSGGLVKLLWDPKRLCPAISSHLPGFHVEACKFRVGFWVPPAQVMEGSIWQYPEYDRKSVLWTPEGTGVRVCKHARSRVSMHGEGLGATGLFCAAYLSHGLE